MIQFIVTHILLHPYSAERFVALIVAIWKLFLRVILGRLYRRFSVSCFPWTGQIVYLALRKEGVCYINNEFIPYDMR